MKTTKKVVGIILILLMLFTTFAFADTTSFLVTTNLENIDDGLNLKVDLANVSSESNLGLMAFSFNIEYSKKDFETIKADDITVPNGWDVTYNEGNGKFLTVGTSNKKVGESIAQIKLKPKTKNSTQVKLTNIQSTNGIEEPTTNDVTIKIPGTNKKIFIIIPIVVVILLLVLIFIKRKRRR